MVRAEILERGSEHMAPFDLSGRVASSPGGNGGIGLGMARGLAAAGAAIVVAARNPEKSEAAVTALAASGAPSMFIALDVADPASCRDLVQQTVDRFGRLDILVNNAGMSIRKPPQDYAIAEWQAVLDTNLTGAFCLCPGGLCADETAGRREDHQYRSMMSTSAAPMRRPIRRARAGSCN